jgi:S-DNA-T family DNA segregation ATPase FtsK/SpoIIIE
MILTLIRADRLFVSTLPDDVTGKHWVYDSDASGARRRLASIEAEEGQWVIRPSNGCLLRLPDGSKSTSAALHPNVGLYRLSFGGENYSALLVEQLAEQDKQFTKIGLASDAEITIGRAVENCLVLAGEYVSSKHALLNYYDGRFSIIDPGSSNGVFVNNLAIPRQTQVLLEIGDVIFIMGLKICVCSNFIALNNPSGRLSVHAHSAFVPYLAQQPPQLEERPATSEFIEFFFRSPRLKRDIETRSFDIEDPPAPSKPEETSLLLRIGPSVCMALGSCFMGLFMVFNMSSGEGNMLRMLPMLFMILIMVTGAALWPTLNSRHKRKKDAEKELLRVRTYASYLDRIRGEIHSELASQKQILEENRISVSECFTRVAQRDRRLFERTPVQQDFLSLRIGTGDVALAANFRWPQDKIANESDALRLEVQGLAREPQIIRSAPMALSLLNNPIAGVVGEKHAAFAFLRGLMVQLLSLHAATEAKTVILCSEEDKTQWDFIFGLPHAFDEGQHTRYLATNSDELAELALRLEKELQLRMNNRAEMIGDLGVYYIVLSLDHELAKRSAFVARIAALRENKGFAVLSYARDIRNLPRECSRIIELDSLQDDKGRLYSQIYDPNDPVGSRPHFLPDVAVSVKDARAFAVALAQAKLEQSTTKLTELPRGLGFLELFEAGRVEHLNISDRWRENNPCVSLAAPVGVDGNGEPFVLNIHEDYHGPHGLIAGMTGSGKSEFIITYILSLAVCYRPSEVSFVLIDYKGGGLAGAFASEKNRLPHLAGTITNLDGGAIRRSLVSIKSELKRRQDCFNRARDAAGLGTMDIYRYQELYRAGSVSEAIPHLLIISDEFAELRSQQPEFMDELVSAARIGRSLGVHLILATQKPSGVVSDQIWSNARFKVSLKVADAADSREMLKVPDAAELVDPGRFYLLVGYNEFFALGQSAYAGTRYMPRDHYEKSRDNSVVLISNTGRALLGAKPQPKQQAAQLGEAPPESIAVLEHLVAVAKSENLMAPALWLDPIPQLILLDDLLARYGRGGVAVAAAAGAAGAEFAGAAGAELAAAAGTPTELAAAATLSTESPVLAPIIGELDDPWSQKIAPLAVPLTEEGNAVIFGSTGSGKATALATLVASLMREHSARSLNIYLLDLGAETLGAFRNAPQVADVLFAADEEKIEMLFRLLQAEMQRRRKLLAATDGGFIAYAKANIQTRPLPTILLIINVFEVFSELFDKHIEALTALSRDGLRYGIQFVLTSSRANGIPYRLLPNFKLTYTLQLNSRDDYMSLLGTLGDIVPPASYARGLVKYDRIYEMQIAQLSDDGREVEAIRKIAAEALAATQAAIAAQVAAATRAQARAAGMTGLQPLDVERDLSLILMAPPVPALPESISAERVLAQTMSDSGDEDGLSALKDGLLLPLGIAKETVQIVSWDFRRNKVLLLMGEDEDAADAAIKATLAILSLLLERQQSNAAAGVIATPNACDAAATATGAIAGVVASASADNAAGSAVADHAPLTIIDTESRLKDSVFGSADQAKTDGVSCYLQHDDEICEFIRQISDYRGFLFIVSLRSLIASLEQEAKTALTQYFEAGSHRNLSGLIVTGEPSRLSNISYENWYRELTSNNSGIWAGSGINSQALLKVAQMIASNKATPPTGFAWLINKGSALLYKHVSIRDRDL